MLVRFEWHSIQRRACWPSANLCLSLCDCGSQARLPLSDRGGAVQGLLSSKSSVCESHTVGCMMLRACPPKADEGSGPRAGRSLSQQAKQLYSVAAQRGFPSFWNTAEWRLICLGPRPPAAPASPSAVAGETETVPHRHDHVALSMLQALRMQPGCSLSHAQ